MMRTALHNHIVAVNLSKSFLALNGRELNVLNSLSFTIGCGEIVSFLGPSGCGKSTILNILSGLMTCQGSLSISEYLGEKRIGYVFQTPRLVPWLTIEGNIQLVMNANKSDGSMSPSDYLRLANLSGVEGFYPEELSEGMKTRAAIARALSIHPNILLCDEPFSNLDEITAMKVRDEIQRIWLKKRFTIVFVTHNPQEAAFLSDRVLILCKRPTNVKEEIVIGMEHPRKIDSFELMVATRKIIDALQKE